MTELHRQVLIDMGDHWWHYEDATLTYHPDGDGAYSVKIHATDGHPPRLIKKPEGTT